MAFPSEAIFIALGDLVPVVERPLKQAAGGREVVIIMLVGIRGENGVAINTNTTPREAIAMTRAWLAEQSEN